MHHPADLTFYDELGVAPDATPEEIRDSFRSLVRIVHPDHHQDAHLKSIAERQMRKLNRVYSVLSDPEKRRRYDDVLQERNFGTTIILSPDSSVKLRRLMGRLAWLGAFALTLALLVWLASENPAAHAIQTAERLPQPPAPVVRTVTVVSPDEVARLRTELGEVKVERDVAVKELLRLRNAPARLAVAGTTESVPPTPPPPVATLTELPSPAAPVPSAAPAVPAGIPQAKPASAFRPFAGFWFYNKPQTPQRGKSALYPPEFIEASITEQNGLVRGKYRSRYKIVDRAISPDVSFEFSGSPSGTTVVAPWIGPGGSKGEITLKMAGENALRIDWTTTELGSFQGLITGTATLMRRLD
ncbi:MAG: J domain-containing protein [Acidobacteriota bacterium]